MTESNFSPTCPIPIKDYPHVLLAHGGGGRLMHQLIEKMFAQTFSGEDLDRQHDSAVLELDQSKIAFTTDSYVVHPLFFPGGSIGDLAVNGTVNDLAMSGARPEAISLSLILEEGLPMETLWQVTQDIAAAAKAAHVYIVTGDTKVVDRGKGDGIFINTSGIGVIEHEKSIHAENIQSGDAIIVNGDLGRHGMAIMAVREGLSFESEIESDTAPLAELVQKLLDTGIDIHCMRDLTRGGLSSALNELAQSSRKSFHIEEQKVPVRDDVAAACEILGLDPLYVANEGRFTLFVPEADVSKVLEIMKGDVAGQGAAVIGEVGESTEALVTLKSRIGAQRILDMLSGEQLPRIC